MVTKCSICDCNLIEIIDVPESHRGNKVNVCDNCGILQLVESSKYNPTNDPHSLRYKGERHIEAAQGAMWGNIRHGKGLRFDAHKNLLEKTITNVNPRFVYDDGANRGHFARFVKKNFPKIIYRGCEPDPICFESHVDNDTPEILQCYTEDYKEDIFFDFIYTAHTLEHVDSVKIHMKKLFDMMNYGATIFIDIPNSENIIYEKYIFEEYFVEKEKNNFMLEDVLNILIHSGFSINNVNSDPYNLTVVAKKRLDGYFNLSGIKTSKSKIDLQKDNVLNYYKKKEETKKIFTIACIKINEFKKNKEIIIYGGGRLLMGFFEYGLEKNNISHIIDNYLYDKIKYCNGMPLKNEDILRSIEKNLSIIVFARSSIDFIIKDLNNKGFKNVQPYTNFII